MGKVSGEEKSKDKEAKIGRRGRFHINIKVLNFLVFKLGMILLEWLENGEKI